MDFEKGKDNISQIISSFSSDLSKLRSGRASTDMIDSVKVNAYESLMPISHVASISIPDARTIVIQTWDKNLVKEVEKAIQSANLGFNPVVDGDIVRISVPALTQELREQYVKDMKERMEQTRVAVRSIRHKMMEHLDSQMKEGVSEDEIKRLKDEVEDFVKESIEKIDSLGEEKEKEMMAV
ncbi:MAG: ribosome recycling factor [bacterium]